MNETKFVPPQNPVPGTEEFRRVKEQINNEGWEGNAAVVIAESPEEASRLTKKLEQENTSVDLRTYIHLNSVQVATADEIFTSLQTTGHEIYKEKLKPGLSLLYRDHSLALNKLDFIDSSGNLKQLSIDIKKINDVTSESDLEKKLMEMGFDISINNATYLGQVRSSLQDAREKKAKEENKEAFDF